MLNTIAWCGAPTRVFNTTAIHIATRWVPYSANVVIGSRYVQSSIVMCIECVTTNTHHRMIPIIYHHCTTLANRTGTRAVITPSFSTKIIFNACRTTMSFTHPIQIVCHSVVDIVAILGL